MITWKPHPTNPVYLAAHGDDGKAIKPAVIVRSAALAQGYLWQIGRYAGFCATLELAMNWAESVAENLEIPTKDRWLTLASIMESAGHVRRKESRTAKGLTPTRGPKPKKEQA